MKRTHLLLNGLRVLDAAARHLSFTRAADELAGQPKDQLPDHAAMHIWFRPCDLAR